MLEQQIAALIVALEQCTEALLGGAIKSEDDAVAGPAKPADRAISKPDNSKDRKKGKGKGKGKVGVTIDSVKAQAKKIALASPDPKECMLQVRAAVAEVSELCNDGNANVGIDQFDATALILIKEELDKFVYTPPEPKNGGAVKDDLEI